MMLWEAAGRVRWGGLCVCVPRMCLGRGWLRLMGLLVDGGFSELRRARLGADEGVVFLPDGRVDMKKCMWDGR